MIDSPIPGADMIQSSTNGAMTNAGEATILVMREISIESCLSLVRKGDTFTTLDSDPWTKF
jgi:hypothetical protein